MNRHRRAALAAALLVAILLPGCKLSDGDRAALARYDACMRQHAGADQQTEYWKEACRSQANAPRLNAFLF